MVQVECISIWGTQKLPSAERGRGRPSGPCPTQTKGLNESILFDGQQYVNMGLTANADSVFHNEHGFVRQEYKEHYIDLINKSFFLNVKVKGPGF